MSKEKELLISTNGLEIKSNSIYKVTNKPDSNAPSGFVKEGTTKLPSEGIANTVPCRFFITNKEKGEGIYDTGLYEESPCYSTMDSNQVRTLVQKLRETIVIPYEKKYGKGILDHMNVEFWEDYGVRLFEGRFFVTSNIDDLLGLYISTAGFELTPKGQEGNPKFSDSQYCIEDKELVRSIKDTRANVMMDAITNFGFLMTNSERTLFNILRYIRIVGVSDDIDKGTLNSMFFEWLNKSEENPKTFMRIYEMTQNEATADIVNIYVILNKLFNKGIVKKNTLGEYMYGEKILGLDLKKAAENLNKLADLVETKIEILEIEV